MSQSVPASSCCCPNPPLMPELAIPSLCMCKAPFHAPAYAMRQIIMGLSLSLSFMVGSSDACPFMAGHICGPRHVSVYHCCGRETRNSSCHNLFIADRPPPVLSMVHKVRTPVVASAYVHRKYSFLPGLVAGTHLNSSLTALNSLKVGFISSPTSHTLAILPQR